MYHFNEIAALNISVLPTKLVIKDNFYQLKIFLVQGYKFIKNEFIELIVFVNPETGPRYYSNLRERAHSLIIDD